MIPALVILFFSALVLVWQGTLAYQLGFALMAISLAAIIWKLVRSYQVRYRIRQETKERSAKWGGVLTVVSGLSSFTGMNCHLFITRQDELVVEDVATARVIPLSEIRRMALFHGRTLEKLNDRQLMKALGFRSIPHFSSVRAWVARNPRARKRMLLVIRFQKPLNELEYSEMAVFSDLRNMGNLKTFAMRPEVTTKTAVLPRRVNINNKKPKLQSNSPSANKNAVVSKLSAKEQIKEVRTSDLPWETSHRLAGKPLHSLDNSRIEHAPRLDIEFRQNVNDRETEPYFAPSSDDDQRAIFRKDDES